MTVTIESPAPRFHSAETGKTRTITFKTVALDVWGHVPSECCAEYGCTCVHEGEDGAVEHDDDDCRCDCTINDYLGSCSHEIEEREIAHNLEPDGSRSEHTFTSWTCDDAAVLAAVLVPSAVEGAYVEWSEYDGTVYDGNGRPICAIRWPEGDDA